MINFIVIIKIPDEFSTDVVTSVLTNRYGSYNKIMGSSEYDFPFLGNFSRVRIVLKFSTDICQILFAILHVVFYRNFINSVLQ